MQKTKALECLPFEKASHIVDVICQHAYTRPDQIAAMLIYESDKKNVDSLSYYQLDLEARRIASWLQTRFSAGDRILLLYPVGLDFVIAFMACLYAGMVAVPAPIPGGRQHHQRLRVKAIVNNANISAILTDQANLSTVSEWAHAEHFSSIDLLATDASNVGDHDTWVLPSISRETLALLQYTSGSTAEPKGVMITHHHLLTNIASFRQILGFTEHTRFGSWIPFYHDMGLIAQLLPALLLGSTYVMMTPITFLKRPYLWLQMISDYRIEHSAAPNFAFELCSRCLTDEQISKLDLSSWKYAVNGSEPVQALTLENFAKRFASAGFGSDAFCPCYGMAEATVFISGFAHRSPVICYVDANCLEEHQFKLAPTKKLARRLVSCGIPGDLDIQIVDPHTLTLLPKGKIGEIWLRGESIASGYWQNASATANTFQLTIAERDGGYLRTGDYGVIYEDELYITGRIKETLIINGRNHYPHDIEYEIRTQHAELGNRLGAIFTVSIPNLEEALVITQEIQGQLSQEDLQKITTNIKETVFREFGIRASAVLLLQAGNVLRTTSGKIQRLAMRKQFLANNLSIIYENIDPEIKKIRETYAELNA